MVLFFIKNMEKYLDFTFEYFDQLTYDQNEVQKFNTYKWSKQEFKGLYDLMLLYVYFKRLTLVLYDFGDIGRIYTLNCIFFITEFIEEAEKKLNI